MIIEESGSFVSGGTTGLQTWEASLRLGEHLLAEASELLSPSSRVLELGSGVGFLAALCAKILPADGSRVTATDVASSVLERLQETRDRSENCDALAEVFLSSLIAIFQTASRQRDSR